MAKMEEITAVLLSEKRPPNCENFFIAQFRVPDSGQIFTAVGNCEEGELKSQLTYRLYGSFVTNEKFGPQLKVATFTLSKPHGRSGVIKYLETNCPHIGRATAEQLWNLFNADAVRVCREAPEVVASKVSRLNLGQCEEIAKSLKELAALEDTSIELIDLLTGRGFPKNTAREAVKRWGNKAPWIIQHDPFKLMAFRGCGFLRCDSLWTDLGLPPGKMKRQIYCAWYAIASDTEGHTWLPESKANEYLRAKIAGVELNLDKAISVATRKGVLWAKRYCQRCGNARTVKAPDLFFGDSLIDVPCPACGDGKTLPPRWIADSRKAYAEDFVARHLAEAEREADSQIVTEYADEVERIARIPTHTRCTRCRRKLTAEEVAILHGDPYGPDCITKVAGGENAERVLLEDWLALHPVIEERRTTRRIGAAQVDFLNLWPDPAKLEDITEHQREKISEATIGRIGILGGSPGTGKTYSAARIVRAIIAQYGSLEVAICAPTGKAAVRCSEALAGYGIKLRATTIHRLLGVESAEDGVWRFVHNANNPLPFKFVICDESSMVDCTLMSNLLAARGRGTHILFIGDQNQLPPVGHGAPLRDMIAAKLPYGELTEIKRNAGTIVRACKQIKAGKAFEIDGRIELEPACPNCEGKGVIDGPEDSPGMAPDCEACGGTGKLAPRNLTILTASKAAAPLEIEKQVARLREAGVDAIWDVQVIVAVNKRSPLARKNLNKRLQDLLNPGGKAVPNSPFRVGDKIICLKNSFFRAASIATESNEKGQVAVANGEFGEVLEVEPKKTVVKFFDPDRVCEVSRAAVPAKSDKADSGDAGGESEDDGGSGCDLDLAYAVTCHKCQGSEFDYVIVGLDEYPGATGKYGICKREWTYTAISRAKIACYLVGLRSTAKTQCDETALTKRKTFLRELIEEYREKFSVRDVALVSATAGQVEHSTNLQSADMLAGVE